MYKINKWLFKFIVEAEYDYARRKQIKHLNKYKIYYKRNLYLNDVLLEINKKQKEVFNDND